MYLGIDNIAIEANVISYRLSSILNGSLKLKNRVKIYKQMSMGYIFKQFFLLSFVKRQDDAVKLRYRLLYNKNFIFFFAANLNIQEISNFFEFCGRCIFVKPEFLRQILHLTICSHYRLGLFTASTFCNFFCKYNTY